MAGLRRLQCRDVLNWAAGVLPYPAIGSRFLALFTPRRPPTPGPAGRR
ncbi:MAG: hypothetical protein WDM85_05930 [Caulobacteraceae bacterium]